MIFPFQKRHFTGNLKLTVEYCYLPTDRKSPSNETISNPDFQNFHQLIYDRQKDVSSEQNID